MLFVTGQFQGKDVEMKLVSAKDLLNEFGVPIKEKISLQYHDNVVKKKNGRVFKKPQRLMPSSEFHARVPGKGEITVMYSDRKPTVNPKTGFYRRSPNNITFGGSRLYKWDQDAEMIAWLLLHPKCADSPLKGKTRSEWCVDDREAKAQKKFEKMGSTMELMAAIASETNELKLRRIALGLKGKMRLISPNSMGIKELKAALGELAVKYPDDFGFAYHSPDVLMNGVIQHAIASGAVMQKGIGGGQSAFHWNKDMGGEIICKVPQHTDLIAFLVGYLSDQTRFVPFMEKLNRHLNTSSTADLMPIIDSKPKEVKDMDEIELVALAEREDAIQYVHGEGVVILNDFVREEPVLHKVDNAKKWREELKLAIKDVPIKRNRLVKRLVEGPKQPETKKKQETEPKKGKNKE